MSACSRFSSFEAPVKLVPLSDLICEAGPVMEKNLRRAFMKLDALSVSITSMRTARTQRQVNITAHLLPFACPPLVRRLITSQGPNTSKPTYVNGGVA